MSRHTLDFTYTDENDEEVTDALPARYEVCPDCAGEGRTLTTSLRGAFTQEEFAACFDDEESQREYFKGGQGIYGVVCETCTGRTTVLVVDLEALKCADAAMYKRYIKRLREEAAYQRMCRAEREMGA